MEERGNPLLHLTGPPSMWHRISKKLGQGRDHRQRTWTGLEKI